MSEINQADEEDIRQASKLIADADTIIENARLWDTYNNFEKKVTYAKAELLKMEIQNIVKRLDQGRKECRELSERIEEIAKLSPSLNLKYAPRSGISFSSRFFCAIYEALRLSAVWGILVLTATFISLPCLMVLPLDKFLLKRGFINPTQQISVIMKRSIATAIMAVSGVKIVVEGRRNDILQNQGAIICFSHASTLDAFIIAHVMPVKAFSVAKQELFLIPFFAWSLWVFGGIPVDRNDREKAISSIRNAALSASSGGCVTIAPEGTRSKSGQLLDFKKGPFYMWDELKSPIVPLVIEGAFDILPPEFNIARPGVVYARFLDPILSHEAQNREEMSNLVRKRMLEAIVNGPADAASYLDLPDQLHHLLALISYYTLLYLIITKTSWNKLLVTLQISAQQFTFYFLGCSIIITLIFYVYLMYILPFFGPKLDKHKKTK